jgi:hypothetical protein
MGGNTKGSQAAEKKYIGTNLESLAVAITANLKST